MNEYYHNLCTTIDAEIREIEAKQAELSKKHANLISQRNFFALQITPSFYSTLKLLFRGSDDVNSKTTQPYNDGTFMILKGSVININRSGDYGVNYTITYPI